MLQCEAADDTASLWTTPVHDLLPLPWLTTPCEYGDGLAVCPSLGMLATSSSQSNTVSLWMLPCTVLGLSVDCTCDRRGSSSDGGGVAMVEAGGARLPRLPSHGVGPRDSPAAGLFLPPLSERLLPARAPPAPASVDTPVRDAVQEPEGLRLLYTLPHDWCAPAAPVPFHFKCNDGPSGRLAFAPACATSCDSSTPGSAGGHCAPLLLVTDAGNDAVHVLGATTRTHVGFLCTPGTIQGPRGVHARGALVAVSAWKLWSRGDHVVHLLSRDAPCGWTHLRVVGAGCAAAGFGQPAPGSLTRPYGVRLTQDGAGVVVTDFYNGRVCRFRVEDGGFERNVTTEVLSPWDLEEVAGGWLVAAGGGSNAVHAVPESRGQPTAPSDASLSLPPGVLGARGGGSGPGEFRGPKALVALPHLGVLVVREWDNARVQVFATVHGVAKMTRMSCLRLAWMAAVTRVGKPAHSVTPVDVVRPF